MVAAWCCHRSDIAPDVCSVVWVWQERFGGGGVGCSAVVLAMLSSGDRGNIKAAIGTPTALNIHSRCLQCSEAGTTLELGTGDHSFGTSWTGTCDCQLCVLDDQSVCLLAANWCHSIHEGTFLLCRGCRSSAAQGTGNVCGTFAII